MIALNGNIVSHTPAGVASFIAVAAKQFYIDPQTHAFQHATINLKKDVSDKKKKEKPNFKFKPSIKVLAKDRLGDPFDKVIDNDTPLDVNYFFDAKGNIKNDTIDGLCIRVLEFQLKTMVDSLDEESKEYFQDLNSLKPSFLLAPYFYLSPENAQKWMKVNVACYQRTRDLETNIPLFFYLALPRELIYSMSDYLKSELSELKPEGILLWVDEQYEESLLIPEIVNFIKFLKSLSDVTDTIYNSHGGYLSQILAHKGIGLLNGIGHSVNYGEHRSVIPIGGGIPINAVSVLILH